MELSEFNKVMKTIGAREYQGHFWLLNGFGFSKANKRGYVIVKGHMPLEHAEVLYKDKLDREEIRCNGHCGCPSPRTQVEYIDEEGSFIATKEEWDEVESMRQKYRINPSLIPKYVVGEQTRDRAFVCSYHIDTVRGLERFVRYVKENNIQG